jgi:hypothetical protein
MLANDLLDGLYFLSSGILAGGIPAEDVEEFTTPRAEPLVN